MLEDACVRFPESSAPLDRLCRLLFVHGTQEDAERALLELVQREPLDAAARHNLGSLYRSMGEPERAAKCLRDSLRLRGESAPTWVALGETLAVLGERDEAIAAFQQALRIAPDHGAAKEGLERLSGHVPEETIASS